MGIRRVIVVIAVAIVCITAGRVLAQEQQIETIAEVEFGDIELSSADELLFRALTKVPQFGEYRTLFRARLGDEIDMDQLTFFPEDIALLSERGQLQIQNRFGVFRTDTELQNPTPIVDYPAFVNGSQIAVGKISPVRSSPDGRFLLYLEARDLVRGDLILHDLSAGKRYAVATDVGMTLDGAPVSWSPRSDYFIYSREGSLYYFSIPQLINERVTREFLRLLGEGSINSIYWGQDGELYYISGSLVYRVTPAELFTRNIYQDILRVGVIIGKAPFNFDPNFDSFWVSPSGNKVLFNKGGRSLFLAFLDEENFDTVVESRSLPYLLLPTNTIIRKLYWPQSDTITLLVNSLEGRDFIGRIYRIQFQDRTDRYSLQTLPGQHVRDMSVSPNGRLVAVISEERVVIKEYEDWRSIRFLDHNFPLHVAWRDQQRLIIAGRHRIELVNIASRTDRQLLALSQAEDHGFHRSGSEIFAVVDGETYEYGDTANNWSKVIDAARVEPDRRRPVASNSFRVFLQRLTSGGYRNIVMVRDIRGVYTTPLFQLPTIAYEPYPDAIDNEPIDFEYFTNGSRVRSRRVSLVFNAIDSAEGLTEILSTLREYDVVATFFLNGDFITRNPSAARAIQAAGHEVGSLFFTYFDMTDSRYRITKEFIKQGLARNEDLFFGQTGGELSLVWHAPYYFVTPEIIQASRELNYTYVGRDVDSLDWVPSRGAVGISSLYKSSRDIIERIIQTKRPGSIIAVRIGIPNEEMLYGGRDDYLFQHLDLLIHRLTERGYSIVPVSELIESSR